MAESVPYQYLTANGTVVPDTSDVLSDVQSEYKTAFKADLIVTPDTPQGVLITAETLARTEVVNNNAAMANQINPNIAGGVFLDAIWALTGGKRGVARQTLVTNVILAGVAGTVIPAGSQAKTSVGDIFVTASQVTLGAGGTAQVNFYSQATGPIPCASNALNQVVSGVLGWETVVNNPAGSPASATTLGTTTQSDQASRAQRDNTLAFQGVALPLAITSALYNVAGVTSLSFLENYEGVPMGILISVTGGTTLAGTIWGLTTTGTIVVDSTAMNFVQSLQSLPAANPWPIATFATTGNVSLSGLSTQGGGDWSTGLTAGQIVLATAQATASQNGLWVAQSGAWVRQAYNASGQTILGSNSGISMKKNSIYTCVAGGSSLDVAAALLENKSSGCAWNGNTTVSVVEPASGQTYAVQFDEPTQVGILIQVTTTNGNAANIVQAILDYAAGSINGLAGFVVGANVSPFEIAGAIMSEYPGYYISNVQVSLLSPVSYTTNIIPIGLNEIAQTQQSFITVNIP
jgi:hypothetical protein